MARYFFTENAAFPIQIGRRSYRFEITARVAGMIQGVFKTVNAAQAQELATAGPVRGVREISEADYAECIKKKRSLTPHVPSRPPTPPPSVASTTAAKPVVGGDKIAAPQVDLVSALKGKGAVVLEAPAAPPGSTAPLPTAAMAMPEAVLEFDGLGEVEAKPKRGRVRGRAVESGS